MADESSHEWYEGSSSQTLRVDPADSLKTLSNAEDDSDSDMPSLYNPFADEDEASGHRISDPLWLCDQCMCPDWRLMLGGYRCARCGNDKFFDARASPPPSREDKSWTFTPEDTPSHRRPDDPGDPASHHSGEFAESETRTDDPTVNPETLTPLSRRQKKAARRDAAEKDRAQSRNTTSIPQRPLRNMTSQTSPIMTSRAENVTDADRQSHRSQWRDDMLKGLTSMANRDRDKDWTLKKGPAPGIKYRGGSPPNPPQWSYHKDDLRAFQKWERKIEIWRIQVSAYLPPNEAAMLLYVNLKGEAEEELEWCDISKINSDTGVQYIIDTLRQPLMTRAVYLKRRYLHEYEYVQRQSNESIRSFSNRYGRIERSLRSVNINVEGMYDSESRGARLLERMRLGLEQQRLILVASDQSLDFDTIREAAQIQFPDHRPTPPVIYTREFDGRSEQPGQQQPRGAQQHRNTKGNHGNKGAKGGGKGKPGYQQQSQARTSYITEIVEEEEAEPEDEEAASEAQEGEEQPDEVSEAALPEEEDGAVGYDDDDLTASLADVAKCLTVTARRLQGMTLGRKFSNNTKTIAQRKAETHCAVCGTKGRWQGDPECTQSSTSSNAKGKGKSSNGGHKKPDNKLPAKKV